MAAPVTARWLFALLIGAAATAPALASPALPSAQPATGSFAEHTRALQKQPGLFDLWTDTERGRVLLGVAQLEQPFLLVSSLPYALGSNDIGLDRGQGGEMQMVHFERHGTRLLLVRDNSAYVANSSDADERAAVRESFASAVLWAGEILATEDRQYLIDFSSFLLADRHGVSARLAANKQGAYQVDASRSAVLASQAKAFADNLELEALLTFAGPGSGEWVRQVAADAASITLRQRISMVRLPALDGNWQPRPYHPYSGGFDVSYLDFATPLASSIDVHWQVRHRLEKTDPAAAVSSVKRPIVYYVDRGAPEPVRSALIEGASWWASAFEKAGYKDAFRVELLPEGADAMDIRYNMIHWVHRATRGWSYGNALADPRTGQILRGAVTLGSQRVRQDILIAESLLAPYGSTGQQAPATLQKMAEQMALARLRQLAAHEVGHTLGFAHNFAASRMGNGSVMDYPHPILKLDSAGKVDLADAYGVGVGPWDDYIVRYIYGDFGHGEAQQQALAALRAKARQAGMLYSSDQDDRTPGASHPDGLLWDFGADSIKTWDQLGAVRQRALQNFSLDVLPDGRQAGELEARLVPVYLLQRYQAEALARLIGGATFESTTAADIRAASSRAGTQVSSPELQRQALLRLCATLRAEYLALPASVLDSLTPPAVGYERGREYFASRMSSVFDALSMAEAGAAQTAGLLFDAERLNRLAWQQARDARQPGVDGLLDQVLQATWRREAVPSRVVAGEALQLASNWVVLDAMLNALDSGKLHPQVAAQLQQHARQLLQWLQKHPGQGSAAASRQQAAELLTSYLRDPRSVKLRSLPSVPPGAPI